MTEVDLESHEKWPFQCEKNKMGKVSGISRFRLQSIKLIKIMISHFWLIYPVWVWHWLMTQFGEAQLITHDWEKLLLEDHPGLMDTLKYRSVCYSGVTVYTV